MIALYFLWQLTSSALCKKLHDTLILPSISRLRQYSSGMSVETSSLDLSYMTARTKDLLKECCIMVLMIDKVYTAQSIEYSNGNFVGLTEKGKRAKTVLTFIIQSVSYKYNDVVCLLPVNQFDSEFLKK